MKMSTEESHQVGSNPEPINDNPKNASCKDPSHDTVCETIGSLGDLSQLTMNDAPQYRDVHNVHVVRDSQIDWLDLSISTCHSMPNVPLQKSVDNFDIVSVSTYPDSTNHEHSPQFRSMDTVAKQKHCFTSHEYLPKRSSSKSNVAESSLKDYTQTYESGPNADANGDESSPNPDGNAHESSPNELSAICTAPNQSTGYTNRDRPRVRIRSASPAVPETRGPDSSDKTGNQSLRRSESGPIREQHQKRAGSHVCVCCVADHTDSWADDTQCAESYDLQSADSSSCDVTSSQPPRSVTCSSCGQEALSSNCFCSDCGVRCGREECVTQVGRMRTQCPLHDRSPAHTQPKSRLHATQAPPTQKCCRDVVPPSFELHFIISVVF